jgi:hypothetical protein
MVSESMRNKLLIVALFSALIIILFLAIISMFPQMPTITFELVITLYFLFTYLSPIAGFGYIWYTAQPSSDFILAGVVIIVFVILRMVYWIYFLYKNYNK